MKTKINNNTCTCLSSSQQSSLCIYSEICVYQAYLWTKKSLNAKGVIRSCKLKEDRQHNGQKKRNVQQSTKHYTENLKIEQHV